MAIDDQATQELLKRAALQKDLSSQLQAQVDTALAQITELPTEDGTYILKIVGGVATWEVITIT